MNDYVEKKQENKNKSIADTASQLKSISNQPSSQILNMRPEAIAQRKLQDDANSSPRVSQLKSIQRMVKSPKSIIPQPAQLMKIRGTNKNSEVSGATHNKHVVDTASQADVAKAAYSDSTFVTSDNDLKTPVDTDTHNFTEAANVASARYDFNDNVKIYLWSKSEGVGKDKPVTKTIDGVSTQTEIGAKKGGDDKIKITHFMKN